MNSEKYSYLEKKDNTKVLFEKASQFQVFSSIGLLSSSNDQLSFRLMENAIKQSELCNHL